MIKINDFKTLFDEKIKEVENEYNKVTKKLEDLKKRKWEIKRWAYKR